MNPAILASVSRVSRRGRGNEVPLGQNKKRGTKPADIGIGINTHKLYSGEAGEPKLVAQPNSANRRGCKKQTVSHEQYDYE
jgi:hypothetical protein